MTVPGVLAEAATPTTDTTPARATAPAAASHLFMPISCLLSRQAVAGRGEPARILFTRPGPAAGSARDRRRRSPLTSGRGSRLHRLDVRDTPGAEIATGPAAATTPQ